MRSLLRRPARRRSGLVATLQMLDDDPVLFGDDDPDDLCGPGPATAGSPSGRVA